MLTSRLILRPLRPDDASAVFQYAHATVEDSRRYIEATLAGYQRGDNAELAIEHKTDKKVIGTCGLIGISAKDCRGEVVLAMAKEYWGSGLMTEGLKAVLTFGFGPLRLNRVFAKVDPDNVNTIRMLRRSGWIFEGSLQEDVCVRGEFRDVRLYSLLKKEFSQVAADVK